MVLASYKQLRNQDLDVLCDPQSRTFDHAFDLIRPIIQGTGDVEVTKAQAMTQESLGKAVDFVASIMTTSTDDVLSVEKSDKMAQALVDRTGRMIGPDEITKYVRETGADKTTEEVLKSIHARKILKMYDPATNFETEEIHGMVARLKRGDVGLHAAH